MTGGTTLQKQGSADGQFNAWQSLKAFTEARIALGRSGTSVPLKEALDFRMAHAHARDAVYSTININELDRSLQTFGLGTMHITSKVSDRNEYIQRPDLGRQPGANSVVSLQNVSSIGFDVAVIVADGLSAQAVNAHAFNLLQFIIPELLAAGYSIAPVVVAENARVALSDGVGELLKASLSLMLIGERPGLSAADSLGAYLTYAPKTGLTDEARNCVSNIRPKGLPYLAASDKICYLVNESLRRKLSGVQLKEQAGPIEYNRALQ